MKYKLNIYVKYTWQYLAEVSLSLSLPPSLFLSFSPSFSFPPLSFFYFFSFLVTWLQRLPVSRTQGKQDSFLIVSGATVLQDIGAPASSPTHLLAFVPRLASVLTKNTS